MKKNSIVCVFFCLLFVACSSRKSITEPETLEASLNKPKKISCNISGAKTTCNIPVKKAIETHISGKKTVIE